MKLLLSELSLQPHQVRSTFQRYISLHMLWINWLPVQLIHF